MNYPCASCTHVAPSYNALIEHGQRAHGEKIVDPGNEFSSPSKKKLHDVITWIRKQPDANLKTGEGKLLLDEIDRLAGELLVAENNARLTLEQARCPHNEVKVSMTYHGEIQALFCAICNHSLAVSAIYRI